MVQIIPNVAERFVSLVRKRFPDWVGFDHPQFVSEETEYKQQAVASARESLSEAALSDLLKAEDYGEIDQRIRASASNLLFLRVPREGDLNVIMQETLDPPSFYRVFYDLLYGEGPSPTRLDRYVGYVTARDLPNKWTFPTYFLFLCHPETEMFVKPSRAAWLLKECGAGDAWSGTPNGKTYAAIKDLSAQLLELMRPYGARDMVDIQSLVYTAHAYRKDAPITDEPDDEDGMAASWAAKIQGWLTADMPPERQETRRQGEVKARALLESKAGRMTESDISEILSAVSSDLSQGKVTHGRFTPVLVGANAREVASQVEAFNEWTHRLWQAGDDELDAVLDAFWKADPINGAGISLPTVLLYLRDPERYGIWLPFMERGLRRVLSLDLDGSRSAASYRTYNQALQAFVREHELPPQAADAITWRLAEVRTLPPSGDLAEPFRTIFADREEAEWALGLMAETLKRLGVERPEDRRCAVTLTLGGRRIRLNHGNWLVMEASATGNGDRFISLDLLADRAEAWGEYHRYSFAQRVGERPIRDYLLPTARARADENQLLPIFYDTVDAIASRFSQWSASLYWRANHKELAAALLDRSKLDEVLTRGLESRPSPLASLFSAEAFDLLQALGENPTKAFYDSEKAAFAKQLEQPFRDLFAELAGRLTPMMRDYLETDKGLFGRILKNDYGRGGAWDYYWGAFYPKGGKRIADAQLYVRADPNLFRFGFYIGEYGSPQYQSFLRRRADLGALATSELRQLATHQGLAFGEEDELVTSLDEWLAMPNAPRRVAIRLQPEEVLATPRHELVDQIVRAFEALFPLVLLASDPNPGPAIRKYLGLDEPSELQDAYPLAQMSADTGIAEADLERWKRALERKGQAILYGPPGTGKTYVAQKLAQHLVGGTDGFVELVQFHPAYAYEDFMLGIRPEQDGQGRLHYPVVRGRFLDFCDRAASHDGPCVLILDEINRANLARVFGELMYLLEYRDAAVPLSVDGRPFRIPGNVRLIGTMNTADRSIALVDHALRRRFAFLALRPQYGIIERWHKQHTDFNPRGLIGVLRRANSAIADPNYELGISFFLVERPREQMEDIWRMEIEPYLEEYFFDQAGKVDEFRWGKVSESILGI